MMPVPTRSSWTSLPTMLYAWTRHKPNSRSLMRLIIPLSDKQNTEVLGDEPASSPNSSAKNKEPLVFLKKEKLNR